MEDIKQLIIKYLNLIGKEAKEVKQMDDYDLEIFMDNLDIKDEDELIEEEIFEIFRHNQLTYYQTKLQFIRVWQTEYLDSGLGLGYAEYSQSTVDSRKVEYIYDTLFDEMTGKHSVFNLGKATLYLY